MRNSPRIGVWSLLVAFATGAVLAGVEASSASAAPIAWGPVPEAWLDGLAQLGRGDARQALASLRTAEAAFDRAPDDLLRARLHAAIAAADGIDAEATAEKLAMRTGAEDLRAFVAGLAEFSRCQVAARQAKMAGADPGAFDRAIRSAALAARDFATASMLHDGRDWPQARRNAERALVVREELVRQKEQQQRDRQREQNPDRPEPPPSPQRVDEEPPRPDAEAMLTPADLQALLQRLAAAEDEKRGVRRTARDARSAGVERDW